MGVLKTAPEVTATCLVLMPFSTEHREVYEEIRRAIEDVGLAPLRMDDISAQGPLISALWQSLRNARCVVADLTGRNPNVFYELGLAHAIGKPTLLLSQSMEDV